MQYSLFVPCKDCTKRVIGCHSTCKDYANYKKEVQKLRQKEITEKNSLYVDRYEHKHNRYRKKR